jgi:hypothetical protein
MLVTNIGLKQCCFSISWTALVHRHWNNWLIFLLSKFKSWLFSIKSCSWNILKMKQAQQRIGTFYSLFEETLKNFKKWTVIIFKKCFCWQNIIIFLYFFHTFLYSFQKGWVVLKENSFLLLFLKHQSLHFCIHRVLKFLKVEVCVKIQTNKKTGFFGPPMSREI